MLTFIAKVSIPFCVIHFNNSRNSKTTAVLIGGSQWGGGFYGYRLKFRLFYGYRLIFTVTVNKKVKNLFRLFQRVKY